MSVSIPDPPADPPIVTRDFLFLVGGHFLQALGYASMLLLPLYLNHLGATRTEIGAIMASAAIGGLMARPLIAWSLDVWGRRPALVTGTLMLVAGMCLVYFVRDVGPLAYVQRAVYGVGVGFLFTGYFTLAADIVPEARRTEGLALFGASGLLPLIISPIAYDTGVAASSLRIFFPVMGGVILLSLLCLLRVPEPAHDVKPDQVRPLAIGRAMSKRSLWSVWLATIAFSTMVACFMAFATVTAQDRGLHRPALLWYAYAGAAVGVRLFAARMPDRVGTYNFVAPALGCYAVAALLVAGSFSNGGFIAAGVLAGVGHGYAFPVLSSQVVSRSPTYLRGSSLAMFTALWELSALLLTPLYGSIADSFDDATMFAGLALSVICALVLWTVVEHRASIAPKVVPVEEAEQSAR